MAFACAVLEVHVLQFALAAGIADGAVERVVAQNQLDHGFARLRDLFGLSDEDLAFGDLRSAGGLQFGHFFLAHQAHAAGGLQREAGIVAEGGDLDAGLAAGVNEQRSRGCGELLSVDCEGYVGHSLIAVPQGLKPQSFDSVSGTTEVVPFQNCKSLLANYTTVSCGTPSFANGQGLPFR